MIGILFVGLLFFVAVPILSVLAIREWAAIRPEDFPAWRRRVGIGSLGAILCCWLFIAVLTILHFVNDSWIGFFTGDVNLVLGLFAVASALSSLALKEPARVQSLVAGVLLVLLVIIAGMWLSAEGI